MIKIRNITVKNFLSVGNVTQAAKFDTDTLTLVLGNNLDMGGDGSRNGTGKTTLINALSYALYGNALYNIKKDNLCNKSNGKNMMVTVDFEANGAHYRIERGRKPNIFRFFVDDVDSMEGVTDEMQGEGKLSQQQIERVLGMSHTMFKHIVALNTYTEPFLSLRANDQREIIEQLLGITQLSEKSEILRELIKISKDKIKEEKFRIDAVEQANEHINTSISDLERRRKIWTRTNKDTLADLESERVLLVSIDIEKEIASHTKYNQWYERNTQHDVLTAEVAKLVTSLERETKRLNKAKADLESVLDHKCYACGQDVHDSAHEEIVVNKTEAVRESEEHITETTEQINAYKEALLEIGEVGSAPNRHYSTVEEAYQHQNKLQTVENEIIRVSNESDPYTDQIDSLHANGLQDINWNEMNRLVELKDHQEFLQKLLTNKDSFIRKRIIEQNLQFLNARLEYYITRLGLPHEVQFQSDLNVSITQLGQDLDFDNLSRGERNRLILGLSWSFRDVFESMNHEINLLCIDELIDSGLDTVGVENALGVLKKMERERGKSILLISHRDELVGRVHSVLQVTKENGFTTFNTDVEVTDA